MYFFSDFPELQDSPFHFFVDPNKSFLSFLDNLQNNKLLTYCSLVFLALNGRVRCPLDYFKNTNINKKLTLVKQACTQHCDEHFSFENLVEEIENLVKNTRWFQKGDCDTVFVTRLFMK